MITRFLLACRVLQRVFLAHCNSCGTYAAGMSFCSALEHPSAAPYLTDSVRELSAQNQLCRGSKAVSEFRYQVGRNRSMRHYRQERYQIASGRELSNLYSTFLRVFGSNAL